MTGNAVIIIPVFNAISFLRACLASIDATTPDKIPVILVDDGSSEDAAASLHRMARISKGRSIDILHHPRRMGFSEAANTGMRAAIERGFDVALILNSDTVLIGDAVEQLAEVAQMPGFAATGPLSNAAGDQSIPRQLPTLRERLSFRTAHNSLTPEAFAHHCSEQSPEARPQQPSPTYVEVPRLHGFALACRLKAIESVGLLDAARFPSGIGVETDLSLRLSANGWRLAVVLDACIWHAGSRSSDRRTRAWKVLAARRNLNERHGRRMVRSVKRLTREIMRQQGLRVAS